MKTTLNSFSLLHSCKIWQNIDNLLREKQCLVLNKTYIFSPEMLSVSVFYIILKFVKISITYWWRNNVTCKIKPISFPPKCLSRWSRWVNRETARLNQSKLVYWNFYGRVKPIRDREWSNLMVMLNFATCFVCLSVRLLMELYHVLSLCIIQEPK